MYMMEGPALRRAKALISVSDATARAFADQYAIDRSRITLNLVTADLAHFAPQPADVVEALRRRLGLEGCRILVYVGFSTPRKGVEYLAAALATLPDDIRLVIVGSWEPGYRQKVMSAAGAAWDRVCEAGSAPDEDIPRYYSLADLVIMPSLLEGFGRPALEALACGTPVIATNAGSLPEVVGPCGLLVPPRDTPALAAAIMALLDDTPRRQQLAARCRERALTLFSPQREYETVLQVYNTLCSGL
jgi:glycosyltransferase involved in cell wall biosynthesis